MNKEGEFLFKTDHEEYFEEAIVALSDCHMLERIAWDSKEFYPVTDFERLWLSEGKEIYSARFKITK